MSLDSPSPIIPDRSSPAPDFSCNHSAPEKETVDDGGLNDGAEPPVTRRIRPSRACTLRAQQRLHEQQVAERKQRPAKKEQRKPRQEAEEEDEEEGEEELGDESPEGHSECGGGSGSTSKIVTSLVAPPEPSQMPRWSIRSMWELASILHFLHVFRPLLNIKVEFSAEEFETALLTPNDTLSDVHIPLLKAIPPITRMALTRDTWITVLCRKLRDWWAWVAEGDLPIVTSHGLEVEVYRLLDPGVRVAILKALCDIRVEQEDIRSYIDNSLRNGVHLSEFRKERIGGDSHGVNYWYEGDPLIGHRLYREIRKVEAMKAKTKGSKVLRNVTYQWETVATNFYEFQDVSEKLFTSENRTEASLGKKLKNNMLPEIEKEHKRQEKLLKKQHRQALLLDNFLVVDCLAPGRSLRDRKPVRYTFDDYDRSINEAIKITKQKAPSPEPPMNRRESAKPEASANGSWNSSLQPSEPINDAMSPRSPDYDDIDDHKSGPLDRSNRRRQRPQRYSAREFVDSLSDAEADMESDEDIVGEAIYDEEYLRKRKRRKKLSSSSEGDEEYRWDEDNAEDAEEEEEEEEEDSLSVSEEESDGPRRLKKSRGRTRRETKSISRTAYERQPGLRRSRRTTRNRVNYRQYELSESDAEAKRSIKSKRWNDPDEREDQSDENENEDFTMGSRESEENYDDDAKTRANNDKPLEYNNIVETIERKDTLLLDKSNDTDQDEVEGFRKRRFLDLNELAPVSGFEDGANPDVKDDITRTIRK